MNSLRSYLPPLNTLVIFEAAGRLGSFTRAASELNITQAAVSYGIRQLELSLGQKLFSRERQRVRLSETGQRYHQDITMALEHVRRSTETLRRQRRASHVTLSCSTAFASWWMLPRLALFRQENPGIDLRLQTTDRDIDLATEGISLGIRRGDGDFPGCNSVKLVDEVITPVCSPAYLERSGRVADVADLARHRLIHLDEPFRPRPTWADYFRSAGVQAGPDASGLHLNDYALVIGAALEGQGIALGWQHQTDHLVERGLLTRPLDVSWRTGLAFHVVWPQGAQVDPESAVVRDWLASYPAIPDPAWPAPKAGPTD